MCSIRQRILSRLLTIFRWLLEIISEASRKARRYIGTDFSRGRHLGLMVFHQVRCSYRKLILILTAYAKVSQCPIAPGKSLTYTFQADQYGTSWYHSHYSAQYSDGIFGAMIIYGPEHVPYDVDIGPVILVSCTLLWFNIVFLPYASRITFTPNTTPLYNDIPEASMFPTRTTTLSMEK
jgi:hypothetical protein